MSDTWSRTWLTLDVRMGVAMISPLPVSPRSRVSMARKDNRLVHQRAKLLKVLGVVAARDQHHVVEPQLAQPMEPLAGDGARALEVAGVVGAVGARCGAVDIDLDVGHDRALAAEVAESWYPLAERAPATPGSRSYPAVELSRCTLDPP